MTQRTLRYLRREQRRKAEEDNPPRLINSNRVRSPDSGSISHTNNSDEISPARMNSSERAIEFLTDRQYADSTSPFARELPSPTVYPQTIPLTERGLRYSRREQRREVAEENSPRWINPNYVGSRSPGSISYTNRFEQIFPAQMRLSQRASQPPTDCNDLHSVSYTHLPRKQPSQTVHPRATEVTPRTLRYLRRTQRREIEEKKGFSLIGSKLRPPTSGPVHHTNPLTDTKKSSAATQTFEHVLKRETVLQHNTDCHAHPLVRHPLLPCESHSPIAHPRAPPSRTTMSATGSTNKTSSAATHLTASASAGQGPPATPAAMQSAPTSPVETLALRAIAGSGPGRSRGHRSSPAIPSTMPLPSHMESFSHLWPQMSPELQRQMANISVKDIKDGINKAETEATRHATELADKAYVTEHQLLAAKATDTARSLAAANTMLEAKKIDLHD